MLTVTVAQLRTIAGGPAPLASKLVGPINRYAAENGIDTPLLMADFLAHMAHETGGFKSMVENLNYSAKRLTEVWPSRFKTLASAKPYANNPEALAEKVYGGRLGNINPGDGWRYRGGGPYQLTGRENYRKFGKAAGVDLEGNPELARDPDTGVEVAARYFAARMKPFAARGDITGSTKALNGGTTGLAERKVFYARAKKVLSTADNSHRVSFIPAAEGVAKIAPATVLPTGQFDPAPENPEVKTVDLLKPFTDEHRVKLAQTYLRNLNYMPIGDVDGKIGQFTTDAILSYRTAKGLPLNTDIDFLLMGTLASDDEPRQFADKRANATPAEVREKVPEAAANWKSKITGFFLGIPAAIVAFVNGVLDNFPTAKSWIDPIKDILGDIPPWAYAVGVVGIGVFLWRTGSRGEQASVEAIQTGARR